MRAPYAWLRELAPTKLPPEALARALTLAGSEVTALAQVNGEPVFELEITPNRADCLSMIGLAREIAAITGGKLRVPPATIDQRPATKTQGGSRPTMRILDRKGCSQYIGRLITGVKVAPSPAWMQQRLTACGIRPINNVVDITNYVLLEWGQPLHAFDWATLKDGTILVRRAQPGERLRTLDDVERTLTASTLVIADAERPVAIAGIMGGTATAVTARTTDVLLESAQFDPRTIRLTSRKLGLSSESSYRFERGIDPAGVELASRRVAQLLAEFAGGVEVARVHAGSRTWPSRTISVSPEALSRRLGMTIPAVRTRRLLASLGCHVRGAGQRWHVTTPSHRRDLTQPADLVEELARLIGYARIPAMLPTIAMNPAVPATDALRTLRARVRAQCIACGLQETITWSLVPETLVGWAHVPPAQAVRITNPLSHEQAFVRPALWPRLVQVAATNLHRQRPGVAIFEIGTAYTKHSDGLHADLRCALAMSGLRERHWQRSSDAIDLFALKGVLESLLCALHLTEADMTPAPHPSLETATSAVWRLGGTPLGIMGALSSAIREAVDIAQPVFIAEWSLTPLASQVHDARYHPVPRTPAVTRDLSLVVEQRHAHAAIARAIRHAGGAPLETVTLIDRYDRAPIPAGHVGLTYALQFRDPARTLTDVEVDRLQAAITQTLTREFHATLRTS